ncbi:hypothetical protein, conserved [Trypanosoma brucei gambiense DAL972]|uniref:Uncharacterized protein n=2 Tax=Trypanosoma brucei TaxID=5691 RepID=C9ZM49_TRYB9|nr:hypothetical protein, conserved [Trypanosoma brucei gambiense DAL972]RHW73248.1 hypothetical protein DPX39_040021400 [Trypanosoma brucei equiperdum]CBH10474.1 hypothetical protein, conserved [Trypanosoma brucei gambiense DAL972]|eukprot:XP_011772764.1 hypothetical protein, conserved [Trypanosoma brucei gambiense DAL972]
MLRQHSPDGMAGKTRVSSITWEDELLLRGVRLDSDLVPHLQTTLSSPHNRSEHGATTPAGSSAILAMVNAGGSCTSSPRSEVRMKNVSPLRDLSAKLRGKDSAASTCDECGVGYSSDSGLSNTWVRYGPNAMSSPRVVVPSLLPLPQNITPPPRGGKDISHNCALPPLGAEGQKSSGRSTAPLSRTGHEQPGSSPAPKLSSSTIAIRDTEATLVLRTNTPLSCGRKEKKLSLGGTGKSCSNDGRSIATPSKTTIKRAMTPLSKQTTSTSCERSSSQGNGRRCESGRSSIQANGLQVLDPIGSRRDD